MGEKGIIVSGQFGNLLARQKAGEAFELGELLVAESGDEKLLLQVFDLEYGSQLNQQHLEMVSGLQLEDESITLMDEELRQYVLARLKNVLTMAKGGARAAKTLPSFFSRVRPVRADDVGFLSTKNQDSLFLGHLRSGSRSIEVPVFIDAPKMLSHHVLIAGTTGRGKSVLMSNLLWAVTGLDCAGMLVLDPHDEYWGRSGLGLKDHPLRERVVYYSTDPPPGARSLVINVSSLRPRDFAAVSQWSDAQGDCMRAYYARFGQKWVEQIVLESVLGDAKFSEATLAVVKRKLLSILSLRVENGSVRSVGPFSIDAGFSTVADVARELGEGKTVIIDTSTLAGAAEVLIASMLAQACLSMYKGVGHGELRSRPVINIVVEEAPRVLGKDVLERGPNVFSTIAREGRKFKVGITAITQLPSLIPREVLANLNTKIILGIELKPERQAIMESAAQDLSDDGRLIGSLDRGEAIVSSTFLRFATPIVIPSFEVVAGASRKSVVRDFGGFR